MKAFAIAASTAALFTLSACGEEKKPAPVKQEAPKIVDTTNYRPSCEKASLEVQSVNGQIKYTVGKDVTTIERFGASKVTPAINTAGEKPKYYIKGQWEAYKDKVASDSALNADYYKAANYVFTGFEAKCPDVSIADLRKKLSVTAPAPAAK